MRLRVLCRASQSGPSLGNLAHIVEAGVAGGRVRLQQRHDLPLLPGNQGALPQVLRVLVGYPRALGLAQVEPRLHRWVHAMHGFVIGLLARRARG